VTVEKPIETFLDGKVRVEQSATGFRSGLDAVMLAAAVPARPGQAALELGAGAGTASLCLAARVPHVTITGATSTMFSSIRLSMAKAKRRRMRSGRRLSMTPAN
jgi:tRNA1(Val) A37 N6-methylase TrmN6